MAGSRTRKPYHCVVVVASGMACDPAKALKNQRFLAAEAPRLPLSTCDRAGTCQCVYKHYDDRRAGPRRASERGMSVRHVPATRRLGAGRRETD